MKLTLNLASRTQVNRRAIYAFYLVVLTALAAVLALNSALLWRMQERSGQVQTSLAELEGSLTAPQGYEEIKPERRQQLQKEIALANDILVRESFQWTALLGRLEEVAVDGVSLRSIQPDVREGSLRITGQARGNAHLGRYLDKLIASPNFSEVFLLDQAVTKVRDSQGTDRSAVGFSLLLKGGF
jgi:type IV pilus assembly protein PilN